MRLGSLFLLLPFLLPAQTDPAFEAYQAWDRQHPTSDFKARSQSLLEASAEWVSKWPDSNFAWTQRRSAILNAPNVSAEVWKQVDEKLIALSHPHTFAGLAAYDWVTARVNMNEAEALLVNEIAWNDSLPKPGATSTLASLVDIANWSSRSFGLLCTLASAQIQLKDFDRARSTIERIHGWLSDDFPQYFDADPLEAFPDYGSKYYILSAQLAEAEGRPLDALAFYRAVITNPWFHREYVRGYVNPARALWTKLGGSAEGWVEFSKVPSLPAGAPAGNPGIAFLPWVAVNYKLPELKAFEGKTTLVYVWVSQCPQCSSNLAGIQALFEQTRDRQDIQVLTLSVDDDQAKLDQFMKDQAFSFPVIRNRDYVQKVLGPHFVIGQQWIVDRTGAVRLQRTANNYGGAKQAFIDEALYKLPQVAK